MSLDHIFNSDSQPFVSQPVCFRSFLNNSIRARNDAERTLGLTSIRKPCAQGLADLVGESTEVCEDIMQYLSDSINALSHPLTDYNFEIDEGCDHQVLPETNLRTLQFLKSERDKRLNSQYKSIALRGMRYDGIEPHLLTVKRNFVAPVDNSKTNIQKEKEEVDNTVNVPTTCDSDDKEETRHIIGTDVSVWNPHTDSMTTSGTGANAAKEMLSSLSHSATDATVSKLVGLNLSDTLIVSNTTTSATSSTALVRTDSGKWTDSGEEERPDATDLEPQLRSHNRPWGDDEIIVHTSVYFGYSRPLSHHEIRLGRLLKVTDRLLLRGNNTLFDLKSAFHCPSDYTFLEDLSTRQPCASDLTKNEYPSSFFFIHDTFYVDKQAANAIDISEPIREWSERRDMIGPMKVKDMHESLVGDLVARLGQPYIYVHQGFCEHIVCFNDLSLRSDAFPLCNYPVKMIERNFRRTTCSGCHATTAQWTVYEAVLMPTTPIFLCDGCYREFCLTHDGHKRFGMMAVPFHDRKAMDESGVFMAELTDKMMIKTETYKDEV